ncbi:VOC family protein [Sulfitobacter sp. F26204]|uniref:VOC family protein n=1 Tax=Sulfitobacter sp. F26204 TaxID=2996014 RepID=UPI00225E6B45|nr:VOC family protein [Sulfitobacter sp. F26204]MCX7558890.1 VOC family protein [Sulfitobacter sp. F26204]
MVTVRRIVADIGVENPAEVAGFYRRLFDLDVLMDQGWIVTLGTAEKARVQVAFLSEGGAGAPVPDLSIEVDDPDEVYQRAQTSGCEIVYPLTDEPWQVRRFFLRDPAGRVINVLAHLQDQDR